MSSFSDYLFSNYECELIVDKIEKYTYNQYKYNPKHYNQKKFKKTKNILLKKINKLIELQKCIQYLYGNYVYIDVNKIFIRCTDIKIGGRCYVLGINDCVNVSLDKNFNARCIDIYNSSVRVPFYYKCPLENISINKIKYDIKKYYDSICYIYVYCTRLGINIDFNVLLLLLKFLNPLSKQIVVNSGFGGNGIYNSGFGGNGTYNSGFGSNGSNGDNINVFAINYNIFRIMSGMGGLHYQD
jgi:hypothetical protein